MGYDLESLVATLLVKMNTAAAYLTKIETNVNGGFSYNLM